MSVEKRRFPRVTLTANLAESHRVLEAMVIWPNQESSSILDLSYKGAAVTRPGLFPVSVQTTLTIEMQLGLHPPFEAPVRVAWCHEDRLGLEIERLSIEGHTALNDYLDAKLIGLRLRAVERAFFSAHHDFQFWFQGPDGVHVLAWTEPDGEVSRVQVDFDTQTVELIRGQSQIGFSDLHRRAVSVLAQLESPLVPMSDFLQSLGEP